MSTRFGVSVALVPAILFSCVAAHAAVPSPDDPVDRQHAPPALPSPAGQIETGATATLIALHRAATGPYFVVPAQPAPSARCCEQTSASR